MPENRSKKLYQDKEWLFQAYWSERMTIIEIAQMIDSHFVTIYEWLKRHGIRIRSSRFKKNHIPWNKNLKGIHLSPKSEFKKGQNLREENTNWKGGRIMESGYIRLYRPNHPHCDSKGYILESRLIAEKVLGRYLKKGEVTHHINGKRDDNRNCNFLICTDRYHKQLHCKMKKEDFHGLIKKS